MNNNRQKTWTIGIPTYNRLSFLQDALASVYKQTLECDRIIISDNGSTDGTYDYCKNLDSRKILYIRNEKNIGAWNNWKNCLNHVKTDYFSWLQDDDILFNDFGSISLSVLKADKDAVAALSFAIRTANPTRILPKSSSLWGPSVPMNVASGEAVTYEQNQLWPWLILNTVGFSPTAVFRSNALSEAVNKLDNLNIELNSLFMERLVIAYLNAIGKVVFIPCTLGILRDHPDEMNIKLSKQGDYYARMLDFMNAMDGAFGSELELTGRSFVEMISSISDEERQCLINNLQICNDRLSQSLLGIIGAKYDISYINPSQGMKFLKGFIEVLRQLCPPLMWKIARLIMNDIQLKRVLRLNLH